MAELLEVTSPDGTALGAEVVGSGPPLLLVHGGTADRSRWAPLLPRLRDTFTLVLLDRRGRGSSAREAADYAIEREGEDVLAVLAALPEPAGVFAHSYGATACLTVLDRLEAPRGVLLYEPPFRTPEHAIAPPGLLERWKADLRAGRREDVLVSFYRDVLAFDADAIERMKPLPVWQARIAAVHTIVREGEALEGFSLRATVTRQRTRFLRGTATTAALHASTTAAAAAVDGAELVDLPGQGHVAIDAAPDVIVEHIREVCG